MLQTSTLRPGLLVSLKTSITGNVSYDRRDIESNHRTEEGKSKAKWETERTVEDPEELERAAETRGKAASLIRSVCAKSAFGLLCPETAAEELTKAVENARALAEEFNSTAKLTRVTIYVMTGRIAPDDVEAVKALNSEVRDLLSDMQRGVEKFDVKVIRESASKAKQLGAMLSVEAAGRVQVAIDAARGAASKIVKAGEEAAKELDMRTVRLLNDARTAFLDLDEGRAIATPAAQGRAIDLEAGA